MGEGAGQQNPLRATALRHVVGRGRKPLQNGGNRFLDNLTFLNLLKFYMPFFFLYKKEEIYYFPDVVQLCRRLGALAKFSCRFFLFLTSVFVSCDLAAGRYCQPQRLKKRPTALLALLVFSPVVFVHGQEKPAAGGRSVEQEISPDAEIARCYCQHAGKFRKRGSHDFHEKSF